jgi:hypothetical protein
MSPLLAQGRPPGHCVGERMRPDVRIPHMALQVVLHKPRLLSAAIARALLLSIWTFVGERGRTDQPQQSVTDARGTPQALYGGHAPNVYPRKQTFTTLLTSNSHRSLAACRAGASHPFRRNRTRGTCHRLDVCPRVLNCRFDHLQ